jgi:GT2 family glycosyltransferase
MPAPPATILISTRNRCEELQRTVASAVEQTVECEILVIDDGSTDDTPTMLADAFPQVRYVRHETSAGYIVRRNEGVALARAPIVVSIDDDAVFFTPRIVEQTLAGFEHPRIGAVGTPFIDVSRSAAVFQAAPPDGLFAIDSYVGTAHALRRDLFMHLGGYRASLFHHGEERDYCIRMLAAGYVTTLAHADPIHHFESPKRDFTRMDLFGRRNDILFAWHNVPMPQTFTHIAATTYKGLKHGWRQRRVWNMVRGIAKGYGATITTKRDRRPVTKKVYNLFCRLKKEGPIAFKDIEPQLPDPIPI